MKFNAKKFAINADSVCRKSLSDSHRQAVDGKEVVDGQIDYNVDGEDYDDDILLEKALELLNMSRSDLIDKINKE